MNLPSINSNYDKQKKNWIGNISINKETKVTSQK